MDPWTPERVGGAWIEEVLAARASGMRVHHTEAEETIAELPHCMRPSNDGLVYVCDRLANRLQAFDKMGNFIKASISPEELHC